MRSALLLLAATVSALLYVTLCVESHPAYNNAPVALLLPNGTIVMVPDRGKNVTTKTSNELYRNPQSANPCLAEANHAGAELRSKLGKSDDQRINQPWMQGCRHVGAIGQDSQQQQQLALPLSNGANKSILINSVEECINKPCKNHPQNTITNTKKISSEACRQLGNALICNPRKSFPDTYEYESDYDIKNADSLKCDLSAKLNRANVQVRNIRISVGSPCNMFNDEASYSNHHSPTRNEFSSPRSQNRGKGGFPYQTYKEEGNNKRPPQNTLASTDQVSSKDVKRRIYNTRGVPDRVERDFDFRNTRDLKSDPSAKLNRADVQFRCLDISAGSPCNMRNCDAPNNYYNYRGPAENEMCCGWARPRTPGHDGFSNINYKKEVYNDHIIKLTEPMPTKTPVNDFSYKEGSFEDASTDLSTHSETGSYSNSKYRSHSKGNQAGFRLNLLGGRNLIDNNNKKSTFGRSIEHSQNVPQEIERPDVSNEKNTFIHDRPGSKGFLQNDPSCEYHNSLVNKESYFEDPVDFSCSESETTAQKKCPRCRPIETGFRVVSKEKRDNNPEFKEHDCYRDVTYHKPKVEKAVSDFCGMLDKAPKYSGGRPMETGFTEDLKKTRAYSSWPQSEEHQRLLPNYQHHFCHTDQFTHMSNGVSGENYYRTNVNAVESINAGHKWKDFLRCPVPNPRNDYTLRPAENSMTALKGPRSARFHHSDSLYCRDKFINDEISHGYCENRQSAYKHRTGENYEEGNDGVNYNSFKEPEWENNRPAMERISMPHSLSNGNGEWYDHQPEYEQERPPINMLARIFQHQTHQRIPPMAQVIGPHLPHNTSRFKDSAASYELFKRLPTFLNQCPECQVLEGSHTLCFPRKALVMPPPMNSSTPSAESLVHCTRLPWMASPIHHPPMATGYRRNCSFLPCFSLPPQPISFASFVKDEDDFWWLIHYETIV